ncbi:MAG: hypothetical protein JGK17_15465 [Microcoleus sp. PH2017_10_PVI_O_A]|uniref:hypothetical protein n=1 Tax=unclassified Microcoleus TaxID=2642155 RepID=UPI001DC09365|nr:MULTISPECIES: hypothetical protein [unclassified Microcoleus]TAE81771.1 MAG: restriction endonuclease [Oscillatoriales cyanobacterium]MCC3406958.1 hypothetical protein [Microcoleus sp. PH2017_10_PVI_O_A]MCC3461055.1 hypothetical protein [Microcoleus sp. PH2017_11_PCY_U_A]MCC3479543.1 hypothetical protein [Microcoleus sp. PH2017_12_PCY_D_A]MCC3526741.1 hypothetical protein [Microcoleus sp. PH2017_21_RUC_O_A]
MMTERKLEQILARYQNSFTEKVYAEENEEHDLLMDVFGISPILKKENKQYWGRELGMCWQLLVIETCKAYCSSFQPAFKIGSDEPCDLIVDGYAIDTKYRIGSGDSGTLKKFKSYGRLLRTYNYEPVFLILREDSLPAAITACQVGTWKVYTGDASFEFIQRISGFDLKSFLTEKVGEFPVYR